ncbi:MAG: hypothetical protein K5923_06380 [Clostridia bacterium]|nr:hypothetical protein [Clostridia bacterium]
MDKFLIEFNKATNDKFSYLRTEDVSMEENKNNNTVSLHLTFIVPYDIYNDEEKFNNDIKAEIENGVQSIVPPNVVCHIKYAKVKIIPEVIQRYVTDYIREHYFKLFNGKYVAKDIAVTISNDIVSITIPVDETIYNYCIQKDVAVAINNYLDSKYSAKNFIKFKSVKMPTTEEFKLHNATKYVDDGIVNIKRGEPVIGGYIVDPPIYISRYTKAIQEVTVCGYIMSIERKEAKSGKIYYVFDIKDPTNAIMHCLYFYRKNQKKSTIEKLQPGQDIIVQGDIVESTFNGALSFFARSISTCIIDVKGTQDKIHFMKKQIKKAVVPEPKPYEDEAANAVYTLLDQAPYICPLLREREFTVFDLETTGGNFKGQIPKIIEIGAVRIRGGQIVSTFETLVDPEEPISKVSIDLTHIFDVMVEESPIIRDAIGPFLKYTRDSILVGQNAIRFDVPIVKHYAEEYGYDFDYKTLDTLTMAKEAKLGLTSNSLESLCNRFNVVNQTPHRALSDALATAKVFIELANLMKL